MKNKIQLVLVSSLAILVTLIPFLGARAARQYSDPIKISRTRQASPGDLALLVSGRPCVTYDSPNQATGKSQVFLSCQNVDGSWSGLINKQGPDAITSADRISFAPQIVIDNLNRPIVSWIQKFEPNKHWVNQTVLFEGADSSRANLDKFNVRVARFDDSAWHGLAHINAPSDNATFGKNISARPNLSVDNYSLALNSLTNRPALTWQNEESSEVYFRYFDGASWRGLSGGLDNVSSDGSANKSLTPTLTYNLAGNPFVAWTNLNSTSGKTTIFLKTFTNNSWRGFNAHTKEIVTSGHAMAISPSVVIWQSRPAVAWMGHRTAQDAERIYLRAWNGSTWQGLSGSEDLLSTNLIENRAPKLSVSVGGQLGASFSGTPNSATTHQAYYVGWYNNRWQGLSGAGEDQVSTQGNVDSTNLILDDLHKPHLMWRQDQNPSSAIYYSRAY